MNAVFKLMIFSIMLNLSVGIMMTAIPAFEDDPTRMGGLSYDGGYSDDFIGDMNKSISPTGEVENKGDAIYRVLDMFNLGFIQKFVNAVQKYMFGFIQLLDVIIGRHLDVALRSFLFGFPLGVFNVVIVIGYILGAFKLWTGKDLD